MDRITVAVRDPIRIPAWVRDFDSFQNWLRSDEFPETGKICYINDGIWVDPCMEELFAHNQVRLEIARVLGNLVKQDRTGRYIEEGMRYSNPSVNLSTEPDGMFLLHSSIAEGRVHFAGGEDGDETEVVGSPDIVIEVVSRSSETKDYEMAPEAYFAAGVQEYWLIDARDEDDTIFDLQRRGSKAYTTSRKQNGWVKSNVLGRSFRLTRGADPTGAPEFTLHVR